jgi:hypothetical protein
MISGFVCECHGFFRGTVDGTEVTSYETFEAGIQRDGWFTNENLVAQTKKLIPLMKQLHPDMDIVVAFDNSMTHHKKAPDGLEVSPNWPLKDGGKNTPFMRKTSFRKKKFDPDTGEDTGLFEDVEQEMQFTDLHGNVVAKGMRRVLKERGLWDPRMKVECAACKSGIALADRREHYSDENGNLLYDEDNLIYSNQCCASGCLSREADFVGQREWLREVVEEAGLQVIYYPKYHCELNYIELIWSHMKAILRKDCTFNFSDLKIKINGLLLNIPLAVFQSSARFCYRFMSGYRLGLSGPLLDYTLKKY